MEFPQNFVNKCNNAFEYSVYLKNIQDNLKSNNSPNVRSYIDSSIDDLQEEINQPIGENEELIHNARIAQLYKMYDCWYELLEMLEV